MDIITNMEKIKIEVLFYIPKKLDEMKYSIYGELNRLRGNIFIVFPLLKINILANI